MKAGDHLLIQTGKYPACAGIVIHVDGPDDIPDVPGAPSGETIREILRQFGADSCALIEYAHGNHNYIALAFHKLDGSWRDSRDQVLTIQRLDPRPN